MSDRHATLGMVILWIVTAARLVMSAPLFDSISKRLLRHRLRLLAVVFARAAWSHVW